MDEIKGINSKRGFLTTPDQVDISYVHYSSGRRKKAVVIAHGFFNSKNSPLLQVLKDALISEYDVILFDFRGHGESSGLFTWTSHESLDLRAVLQYAQSHYSILGLIGFSLGAATSINVLAKYDCVQSFISISAPGSFWGIDYHFWALNFENDLFYTFGREGRAGKGVRPGPFWLRKEKPIKNIESIHCPVCYIHGEKDWVILPYHSQRLFSRTKTQKVFHVIPNGFHAEYLLRQQREIIIDSVCRWLTETLHEGGV